MSSEKLDYEVITDWELRDFRSEVQAWLDDGWVCQGGVSITISDNGTKYYAQAIVRVRALRVELGEKR